MVELLGHVQLRQPNNLGKGRIGATRSARQRRDEARERRVVVPVDQTKIDRGFGTAGRAADPQEPVLCRDRRANRRREQHRHPLGLALVPGSDQALGVLEDLAIGCSPGGRLFLRGAAPLIFHLALVEAHGLGIRQQGKMGLIRRSESAPQF
jgi:hypothetical protein